jgi:hypothetical protein
MKRAQWGSKGKYNGKCYNPQKPRKWGLNICLCDSMNGYIFSLTFLIMEGPQKTVVHPGLPLTSWTAMHLVQILQSQTSGRGFHALRDRFYPNPQSAVQLHKMKIHTTCIDMTLWKDFLTKFKRTQPGNHENCPYQTDKKLMCQSLQDKCLVNMLSIFL